MKEWYANMTTGRTIFITEEVDFRARNITRERETFHNDKGVNSVRSEDLKPILMGIHLITDM